MKTHFEDVRVESKTHETHVTAVRPPMDGNSVHVDETEPTGQTSQNLHLVGQLNGALKF
jgi:hypothetical protein